MIELQNSGMPLNVYEAVPEGAIRGGIIVIHEIWGLNDHTKSIANRYAAEGYLAIAPDLVAETNIKRHAAELQLDLFNPETRNEAQPKLRALMTPMQEPGFGEKTLSRIKTCFDYLYDKSETKQWIAVTGFCFGGSYSFSLAINEPRLKAALPFYGHAPLNIDELKRIQCPILAFYGQTDKNLIKDLKELKKKMATAGVNYTAQTYPDTGHAFFNDTNPYAYNEVAANDSWQRSLTFLRDNSSANL